MLITPIYRRMNEVKSEIDIPDDIIMKFEQFWSDFKDAPLKGKYTVLRHMMSSFYYLNGICNF